jgi:hypothetical protein
MINDDLISLNKVSSSMISVPSIPIEFKFSEYLMSI